MKLESFIVKKISSGGISGKKLAGPVVRVAVAGIILGMVVMILSLATGLGFQKEIREKIIGFGSHIQVISYDFNLSYQTNPIKQDSALEEQLREVDRVRHVQRFATKPGLMKTDKEMQGLILRGVGPEFDWTFFRTIIREGDTIAMQPDKPSVDILISDDIAELLQLNVGDNVPMYFFEDQVRARNFNISGIFDSNLPELDEKFVLVDIRQVQKLNNWNENQISGYELLTDDFESILETGSRVSDIVAGHISEDGTMLRTRTIRQTQPQIFGWLDLLDMNIVVIIVLIVLVAGFNMITGILILILERTNMIGILKALGITDWSLRKVFLTLSSHIVLRGLFWGNLLGLLICWLQARFGFLKLNPDNYFLETVPIHLSLIHIIILNAGAVLAIFLMMIGPSYLTARISPVKAIRFE